MAIAGWPIASFPIAGAAGQADDSAPSYAAVAEEFLYQTFQDYTATSGDFYNINRQDMRPLEPYVDNVTPFFCPGNHSTALEKAFW